MTAPRRRLIVKELCEQFHASEHRACRALDLARSGLRYAPVVRDEQAALARVAPRLEAPGWGAVALRLPAAAVAARVGAPVAVKVPGHLGSA